MMIRLIRLIIIIKFSLLSRILLQVIVFHQQVHDYIILFIYYIALSGCISFQYSMFVVFCCICIVTKREPMIGIFVDKNNFSFGVSVRKTSAGVLRTQVIILGE